MDKRLLTIEEIALRFNVSKSTVRRWIQSKKLVGHKVGVQWRFDPDSVKEAFEQGRLSGVNTTVLRDKSKSSYEKAIEWAIPTLMRWRTWLKEKLEIEQPEYVVVNDRRGAKIWGLIMPNRFNWGANLWHSTAIRMMAPESLKKMFANRKVLLFDEIMQRGRELNELRQLLKNVGATVISFVCVRSRSHAESGELLEYEALACEDLEDKLFTDRATLISRLVHLIEPPLDVDHLIIRGDLDEEFSLEEFLEKLANSGIPFIVWFPDREHKFMSVTLDRPQFFETEGLNLPNEFLFDWRNPCKIRFYFNLEERICDCSFIVYPDIEAPSLAWKQTVLNLRQISQSDKNTNISQKLPFDISDSELCLVYWTFCMEFALKLFSDFVEAGINDELGINFVNSHESLDIGQLIATFGRTLGNSIAKRTKEIINFAIQGEKLFHESAKTPPDLIIRTDISPEEKKFDYFKCRTDLMKAMPPKYPSNNSEQEFKEPLSYVELLYQLPYYSESTISRTLDLELDKGTVKPLIQINRVKNKGNEKIRLYRAFCRGEFGVWFEWNKKVLSHDDIIIQRTLGLGPSVVEKFLKRVNEDKMTATHFNKIFANIQHDLRENAHDLFYLGWKPYKFGPIATTPEFSSTGDFKEFERFLVEMGCLEETREKHRTKIWRRYSSKDESIIEWRKIYKEKISAVTRAHISGLIRLYAEIQNSCKTKRPSAPRSSEMSLSEDPLVVLASARNEKLAYICGWFEVYNWRCKGKQSLFPFLISITGKDWRIIKPFLRRQIEEFASSPRLLIEKIEMYRNLPFLREQIEDLIDQKDLEAGEVLLETVDSDPIFESQSIRPVQNLIWASRIMRSFTSMTRQILTKCKLDEDTRKEKVDKSGRFKDATYYLKELLSNCPELKTIEKDLRLCIQEADKQKYTVEIGICLFKAFKLILHIFDTQKRIPDPRPQYQRDWENLQTRGGLITRIKEIQMPEPYAIAIADIKNFRNLPRLGEIFGIDYVQALDEMLDWVETIARKIEKQNEGIVFCGFPIDNLIFAGKDANAVYKAVINLIEETAREFSLIDRNQLVPFGLLRVGIAWKQDTKGKRFQGYIPGLIAHEIGDKSGGELGTISITEAVYDLLSDALKNDFKATDEESGQGKTWIRFWKSQGMKNKI